MKQYEVYTDGSANNKIPLPQRVGGFAAVILAERNDFCVTGARLGLTSQQAEMMAVIASLFKLSKIKGDKVVKIYSDSAYIVNCFKEKWYEVWRINNFSGKANVEYWNVLLELSFECGMSVEYNWVPGHKGIENNERADRLALAARKQLENTLS